MGRPAQPEIRLALLEEATDYALEHGLPDSLEPFARATGASSRMLLYHFGTRDRLMRAVLERARERQVDEWSAILQGSDGMPYTDSLAEVWATMTGPTGRAYLRMFGQLRESSEQRL